jgi:beta-barrel assembly-enhancing protease
VNRRRFLASGCAALAAGLARAQEAAKWGIPARFARPDAASDEGGLWSMMDREETRLRRSPFALRDAKMQAYIQGIACKLASNHCPDVRVHLVKTPYFNASMAPNGMMQVWSGLMLRVENEAQLAAVLGHEIGHYLQRHTLEQLRDAKQRSAFGMFIGMFGVVGALGQLGLIAGQFAYGREHEREADTIGVTLMRQAGYDAAEAAKVWENLQLEIAERPDSAPNPLFATHPMPAERMAALAEAAKADPGGVKNEEAWREHVKPFLQEWIADEIKRGQREESLALFTRLASSGPAPAPYLFARGEVFRLRNAQGDLDLAMGDYLNALQSGGAPPETHRGLGFIHRSRSNAAEAKAAFQRYLEAAPQAPDAGLIKSYLEESPA